MAQSLNCMCCRCELNRELSYEFPSAVFPLFGQQATKEFNTLEVDRIGAVTLCDYSNPSSLVFKQTPKTGHFTPYSPGVRPLTPVYNSYLDHVRLSQAHDKAAVPPRLDDQMAYWNSLCSLEGVPETLLSNLIREDIEFQEENASSTVDVLEGNRLAFCEAHSSGVNGYAGTLYCSHGYNNDKLYLSGLVNSRELFGEKYIFSTSAEEDRTGFQWASRRASGAHCELIHQQTLPTPAREIVSAKVHGRGMVAVRSMHQCLLYEDTLDEGSFLQEFTSQVEEDFTSDSFQYDTESLRNLFLFESNCQVSAVAINPYNFGEAVVVMETGEVHLCGGDKSTGSMVVQKPLWKQSTPHWWSCCYGAHPQQLILAECVGMGVLDLRSEAKLQTLLNESSLQWKANDMIAAVKPHPQHPMEYLVATSNYVMVVDIRMKREPVLSVPHELLDQPLFIDTVMDRDSLQTSVVVGTRNSETVVVNFEGGMARSGGLVAPPHFTALPHTLPSPSSLAPALRPILSEKRVSSSVPAKGMCFGACCSGSGQLSLLQLTAYDDLFLNQWTYSDQAGASGVGVGGGGGGVESGLVRAWCREVDQVELPAHLEAVDRRPRSKPYPSRATVTAYVFSSESDAAEQLCCRCFTYCSVKGISIGEIVEKALQRPGRTDGQTSAGKCCVCSSPNAVCRSRTEDIQPTSSQCGEGSGSLAHFLAERLKNSDLPQSDLGKRVMAKWPDPEEEPQDSGDPSLQACIEEHGPLSPQTVPTPGSPCTDATRDRPSQSEDMDT